MRTPFIITVIMLIIPLSAIRAQNHATPLDAYLQEGLKNNIVLQQKNISLEKAMLSLKIAQGSFLPTVGFQASYTSGEGGRNISIPVGDMLNPVYTTLNQLTESNAFPQIENVNQNFFPHNQYDVHVRTSMPLYNSALLYNKKIASQQVMLQEYEADIYKRELVKNIKTAYFNYLSAKEALHIYENALNLTEEGKRVNESLLNNGKGLPAYVIRSESEIESVHARIIEAKNQVHNAQLYFNFLLNRDGELSIDAQYDPAIQVASIEPVPGEFSIQGREELQQVQQASLINETILKMNKSFWQPKVSAFFDLGSQQQNWQFDDQSRYYLLGLQVDVPIFAGFTNRYKTRQSEQDVRSAQLTQANVQQSINLSVASARHALETALQNYQSAQKQQKAAESYSKLIEKGYKEGVNTFIESIDARNQLTNAQLQTTINQYRVLIAHANYERETSAYSFE